MFYIITGTEIYLVCTLSCTGLFYREMICFIETYQHACTQNTHAPTVSYITLGKNHEAEACWLNYLMRCNKSWQDQLALESGFSSFYHYIEMWTIVERNVTLLCCSLGTQLCSSTLKSSTSMDCKAWWMMWKMLLMQRSRFLVLFLKFWKCFHLAGHRWNQIVVSTEILTAHTLAEQNSSTGEWSPEYSQSLTLPATKLLLCCTARHDILSSFSFHLLPRSIAGWLLLPPAVVAWVSFFKNRSN